MLGVLGVLAILLAITIPVLQKTRSQARNASAKAGLLKIESALNLYRSDFGTAPDTSAIRLILAAEGLYTILGAAPGGPMLSPSENEPFFSAHSSQTHAATGQFLDPWKTPYWIRPAPVNNPGGFDIFSAGPDKTRGNTDDINNWGR